MILGHFVQLQDERRVPAIVRIFHHGGTENTEKIAKERFIESAQIPGNRQGHEVHKGRFYH
jgi:hypothetical protein